VNGSLVGIYLAAVAGFLWAHAGRGGLSQILQGHFFAAPVYLLAAACALLGRHPDSAPTVQIALVVGLAIARQPAGIGLRVRAAVVAAVLVDLDRVVFWAAGTESGGRGQPVRDRVPVRDDLLRVHPAVADAGVAWCDRDVEPGVLHT
jgi:hypothetical protein